ncbi:hypothetical protein ACFLU5_14910 [Bacteroidota bacterium]
MDALIEFAKLIVPALLVLYAVYLTLKNILEKEVEKKHLELKSKNIETILPMRMQAFERLALLLERSSPNNLILRLNNPAYSATEFQVILVREIREEFNHNLSQQIYISEEGWTLVKKAIEDVINIINQAAAELKEEARGVDLTKSIFDHFFRYEVDPISHALSQLKKEVAEFY